MGVIDPRVFFADRRDAALHEAAHAILISKFGGSARAYIWPNPGGDSETKSWLGSCEIYARPGSFAASVSAPASDALAMTGLAGTAAEMFDRSRDVDQVRAELRALLELGELSATDKLLVPDDVPDDALEETARYVATWWSEIETLGEFLEHHPHDYRPGHLQPLPICTAEPTKTG